MNWLSLRQIWLQTAPRVKWILIALSAVLTFIAIILYRLHNADARANDLASQLLGSLTKQRVAVINGKIESEKAASTVRQEQVDALNKQIEEEKAQLSKKFEATGASSDEIARRFADLGLNK